jgi:saccharopine dehydrogenase (NAD+, L-lysine-forming)
LLALVAMGVEPGFSDVVARYASDHLFSRIDEIGVRDGADLVIEGFDFAPTFSIWTTIEECLNPPIIYERERGWFTTAPFSEPETFVFPEGIGSLGCVNVEHEEVHPHAALARCRARHVQVRPRRRVHRRVAHVAQARSRQHPPGQRARSGCVATRRRGRHPAQPGRAGRSYARPHLRRLVGHRPRAGWQAPRRTYLYQVVDNEWTMREYGHQAVVWQTAVHPVVALEMLATGEWKGEGVKGPEAFRADPFLALLERARRTVGHAGARPYDAG